MKTNNKTIYAKTEGTKSCLLYGRYSTDKQTTDRENEIDSDQLDKGIEWAKSHGYSVRKTFRDAAISGFRAKNQKLEWSKLVKELRPGESILVRDLDRIGRNNSMQLGGMIYSLLENGHNVISWLDGKTYTIDNVDELGTTFEFQLKTTLSRQESIKKKDLQNGFIASWVKQLDAGEVIKLKMTPFWLEYQKGKYYVIKTGMIELITRIYKLSLNGFGPLRITRELIKDNVELYNGEIKMTLNDSTISRLLKDKAVIGNFNYKGKDYPDYYPKVISEELYYSVQNRSKKLPNKGGRPSTDNKQSNLFTYLFRCKHCGNSFYTVGHRKDSNRKKRYLVCGSARLGKSCEYKVMDYYSIESSFLIMFSEFDFVNLFDNKTEVDKETESSLVGIIEDCEKQISKYTTLIDIDTTANVILLNKLNEYMQTKNNLSTQLENFRIETKSDNVNIDRIKEVQKEVYSNISDPNYRIKLKAFIREIVERIDIDAEQKTYYIHYKNSDKIVSIELQKDQFAVINTDGRKDLFHYGSKPFHIFSNFEANEVDNPE